MGTWGLIQIVFNIFLGLGLFIVVMRISRQPKDDPRLSRGLQLLQAKIAVIEDLSDRTEVQVNQMTALLEQKVREVQNKIELADRHVQLIRASMQQSLEVAKIFQDKIPHQEIIERQNTLKYLQAARLAHQGMTVAAIALQVDLPEGEIEFIAKVNREQLMFSEDQLPEWARAQDPSLGLSSEGVVNSGAAASAEENRRRTVVETVRQSQMANQQELVDGLEAVQQEMNAKLANEAHHRDYSDVFNVPKPPMASLAKLGEEFRKACGDIRASVGEVGGNAFTELVPPRDGGASFGQGIDRDGRIASATKANTHSESVEASQFEDALPLLDISQEEIEAIKKAAAAGVNRAVAQMSSVAPVGFAPAPTPNVSIPIASPSPTMTPPLSSQPHAQHLQQTPSATSTMAAAPPVDPRQAALAQARAAAMEMQQPHPRAVVHAPLQAPHQVPIQAPVQTPAPVQARTAQEAPRVINARPGSPSANQPVIRRVEFPRIKSNEP